MNRADSMPMAPFGARLVREHAGLDGAVTWLDTNGGRIVSVLQDAESGPGVGGVVYVCDAADLEPRRWEVPHGRARRVRFSDDGARLVAHEWVSFGDRLAAITVLDARCGGPLATRTFGPNPAIWDAAFVGDRVALAVFDHPWRHLEHRQQDPVGAKLELVSADLASRIDTLAADDAGFEVVAHAGVVASTGIDLHLWWPGSPRPPFSLHGSPVALDAEFGPCSLSRDGCRAAFCVGPFPSDTDVFVIRTHALDDAPVALRAEVVRRGSSAFSASSVALNDDGTLVAVAVEGWPVVRVHRSDDGALVGAVRADGPRAMCWLDREQLVIGGETLSVWRIETTPVL